mmetsp:Transcript_30338/g.59632  ORF Transcript_30338/g.59632 Transcript_30338/m.59632 type:complete len:90 (-) Transcript_30338:4102-4371(-)
MAIEAVSQTLWMDGWMHEMNRSDQMTPLSSLPSFSQYTDLLAVEKEGKKKETQARHRKKRTTYRSRHTTAASQAKNPLGEKGKDEVRHR